MLQFRLALLSALYCTSLLKKTRISPLVVHQGTAGVVPSQQGTRFPMESVTPGSREKGEERSSLRKGQRSKLGPVDPNRAHKRECRVKKGPQEPKEGPPKFPGNFLFSNLTRAHNSRTVQVLTVQECEFITPGPRVKQKAMEESQKFPGLS